MALPLACAIVPLVLGLDAGALPILGVLVLLAIEFLAIRAYACGPATRWLATMRAVAPGDVECGARNRKRRSHVKRVLIIATGGTIACTVTDEGLEPT